MTAPNHFQVDLAQIRAHAGAVSDLAGELSSVNDGLSGGGVSGNALGTFVQFLASGLHDAMTQTTQSVGHASSAVDNVGAALRRTADGYQHTDEDNAARLRQEDPR
ncbi:MAG TPA: type VII secretion target [Pseudonocardiaceae bacterium]|jgi:uncharacterized protein YukE|nr:type VII secretion target [Pseudonocardiaceae bacterium]